MIVATRLLMRQIDFADTPTPAGERECARKSTAVFDLSSALMAGVNKEMPGDLAKLISVPERFPWEQELCAGISFTVIVAHDQSVVCVTGKRYPDLLDLAVEIYERLQNSYSGLFDEVRKGPVLASNGELVVTGTITKYDPGNISERGLLIGLGAASFNGELTLKDAKSGQVLLTAPINKLWAWGGATGVSKRIENMMFEAAAAIAGTIAHAKGWQAPPAR